nr:glycoprotein alpha-2 [Urechis unicinctus]
MMTGSAGPMGSLRLTMTSFMLLCIICIHASNGPAWSTAGCHRLGHTREIHIPNCVKFRVTTNACRGYCTSYAFPSPSWVTDVNPNHQVTSRGECCSITSTHDVHVNVRCTTGIERLTFKSAASCNCDVCRNE